MKGIHHFIFFLLSACLASCAIQVAPSGGAKDITPPKVINAVPANFSTGFTGHDLSITFDEYIQLKDLSSQLVVSPPLKYLPESKLKKRTLSIHLDDTLLANTTYTLNFGNSILDHTEGNALENFQYAFATGPVLDTLSIQGSVENALDLKKEKGILIMLYRDTIDSVPLIKRPLYFAKTSESGTFNILNISPGSYKLFALQETNGNYMYDGADEQIAFMDAPVQAPASGIVLRKFKEIPPLRLLRSFSEEPGKVVMLFSGQADSISFQFITDTTALKLYASVFSKQHDTLTIWYRNLSSDSMQVFLNAYPLHDTVSIRLFRKDSKSMIKQKSRLTISPALTSGTIQELHRPLELNFNHPVTRFDISGIRMMQDSLEVKNFQSGFADSLHLHFQIVPDWQEGMHYTLFIPPGTFTDLFELSNDTVMLDFRTRKQEDYGSVAVQFKSVKKDWQYILQLIDEKEVVYREAIVSGDSLFTFSNLDPRSYRLKWIGDRNKNNQWDTGDYLKKNEPEGVDYYPESITVRANWDVEIKWNAKRPESGH